MFQTGLIWTGVERYRKFLKNLLFEQGKDVKVGPIKQKKKIPGITRICTTFNKMR